VKNVNTKLFLVSILFSVFTFQSMAQGDMLTREEKLIGSTSDFLVGLHTGIFDCNQTVKYPVNVGFMAQYNYTPDVMKSWYLGAELGGFYTQSPEDDNLRTMGALIGHVSIYPGYTFELGKKEFPEEDDLTSRIKTKKLRIAAGVTVGTPLKTYSSGITYDPDNAKTGFGFTGMLMYELPNRLNIFGSVTSVGSDMDGFGFDPETGERIRGNEHKASWWYKVGIAYNLMGR
jgi:hypothetical protein